MSAHQVAEASDAHLLWSYLNKMYARRGRTSSPLCGVHQKWMRGSFTMDAAMTPCNCSS